MAVRVRRYDWKTKTAAYAPGYTNVIIHPGQPYGDLFALCSQNAQKGTFSRMPISLPESILASIRQHQYSYIKGYRGKQKIWNTQTENHLDENGYPPEAYWAWREKGMTNEFAIRYPNSYRHHREGHGAYFFPKGRRMCLLDYI